MSDNLEIDDAEKDIINDNLEEIQQSQDNIQKLERHKKQLEEQLEEIENQLNQNIGSLQTGTKSLQRTLSLLKNSYDVPDGYVFDADEMAFVEDEEEVHDVEEIKTKYDEEG